MPDAPEKPPPQPPAGSQHAGRGVTDGLLGVALLSLVAAGSAWLLAPGSAAQRLPGDEALGAPAVGSIKASRDYDIPDEETTERRREEASAAERRVYDHDDGSVDEAAARVHWAFQLMRDAESEWREPDRHGRGVEVPAEGPGLLRAYAAQRDAFVSLLQSVVRDDDFAALAEARFSETVEQQLVGLSARGLAGLVAQDRQLLAAERERGLWVREVRDGATRSERALDGLAGIRDMAQARQDVERAGAALPRQLGPRLRAALVHLAVSMSRPTLTLNQGETQRRQREAAERVKPVVIPLKRGEEIVGDGERIEPRHLVIFGAIRAQTRELDRAGVRAGGGALVALLVLLVWRFARRGVRGFRPARKDAVLLAALFLGTLGLAALGLVAGEALHDRVPAVAPESFYYLVPFAAGAVLVRAVLPGEVALLFSLASGAAVGLCAGHSIFFGLYAALTSVAASGLGAGAHSRGAYFRAGAAAGGLGALLVLAITLFTGGGLDLGGAALPDLAASAVAAFAGSAVLVPLLAVALLPLVESVFGHVSDLTLLGLANLNHPALKELIVQAPGTYHHSIVMGSLVEEAAQAIGANALLARVSAYYHDLGKIRNPLHFSENQRGENRHEQLAPSMSALIVKRHVTDGLELAAQWKLPAAVAAAIPQHHGTRHVSFFWAKAQKAAEEERGRVDEQEAEALYRYSGPKPQTREAALVMIADACEASSRALPEPTRERLAALVQRRINEIFVEGQLDECELTLKDLNAIAGAMARALEALYHARAEVRGRPVPEQGRPPVQLVAKP